MPAHATTADSRLASCSAPISSAARPHQTGIQEMTKLTAQAAGAHTFNEAALRQILGAIAQRSRATGEDIDRALEEGFRQGVTQAMSDGILTRQSGSSDMGIDAGLAGWGFIPGGLTFGDDVGRDGSDIGWSDAGWCGVLHSGG